jgi:hypothetical protein
MSDSAEGDVPRTGADTNQSDPAQASIGPDAAEQFASAFVPAWQFEDTPFSAGARLSEDDIQDLGNGGTATSTRVDLKSASPLEEPPVADRDVVPAAGANEGRTTDPFPPPALVDTTSMEPSPTGRSISSSEDGNEEAAILSAPLGSRGATSVVARVDSLDDSAIVRSFPSRPLLLGLGAGIVAIVVVFGIMSTRAEAPAAPAALATSPSPRAAEDIPIRPPPRPPEGTTSTTPTPPQSEATPSQNIAPETLSDLPSASQSTSAQPTHAEEPPRPPRNPQKSAAKPAAGGTIIRDNPF